MDLNRQVRFIMCKKGGIPVHQLHRPRKGHTSLFANDTSSLVTAAVSAGVGATMLMAAATPAAANPFDLRPSYRPQVQSAPASAQRLAYRARDTKEKEKTPPVQYDPVQR